MTTTTESIVGGFVAALQEWRADNPGWTEAEQLRVFSPHYLWRLAGGNRAESGVCVELMKVAGYVVRREPGDDGNLPCGWPARTTVDGS